MGDRQIAYVSVRGHLNERIGAVTLAVIAGAYIGFAATDGSVNALVVELGGTTLFGGAALLGVLVTPPTIPLGLLAHAGWDFLHHNAKFGASIPKWYIPFCVIVDVAAGGALLVLYLCF